MLFGKATVAREIRRRKLRNLLHSTHLYTNLPKILECGQLDSAGSLKARLGAKAAKHFLHDPVRYEKFAIGLDYINCALTEPNYELLYKRSKSDWHCEWVHLALNLPLLEHEDTRFCPVSAAKDRGRHLRDGVEGFQSMFDEVVDNHDRKGLGKDIPTHPQAEALIKGPLPLSAVREILLSDVHVRNEVQRLVEFYKRDIPVRIEPKLFFWPERLKKPE